MEGMERRRGMKTSIPCDVCSVNIVKGLIYRVSVEGLSIPLVICEDCHDAISEAEAVWYENGEES
jgi:hypothetical protein